MTKFMERLSSHLDDKLKPVSERITNVESTVTSDLGSRQVADAAKNNKDLYEWKDEISVLLKESPGLKITRALAIARAENPDKAEAMKKKYAKTGEKDDNVHFLSMTPTSRTGNSDGKEGKMKFQDAADKAFDDVVASFGGASFAQLMGNGR